MDRNKDNRLAKIICTSALPITANKNNAQQYDNMKPAL